MLVSTDMISYMRGEYQMKKVKRHSQYLNALFSKIFCCASIVAALVLLVGPLTIWLTISSVWDHLSDYTNESEVKTSQGLISARVREAYEKRILNCRDTLTGLKELQQNVAFKKIEDEYENLIETPFCGPSPNEDLDDEISSDGAAQDTATVATAPGPPLDFNRLSNRKYTVKEEFFIESYKSATSEIRDRIFQEYVLFALKFTIVGGIFLVLFRLSRKEGTGEEFENFVQKRRSAIFFSAAILASIIVDTRLRFDAKVMESIGSWVWCIEHQLFFLPEKAGISFVPWEHSLFMQIDRGAFLLLRYFSLSLTLLIYGVTAYLFLIMPRGIHRSTWRVIWWSSVVMFLVLVLIGVSYPTDNETLKLTSLLGSLLIGALGILFLRATIGLKRKIASVVDAVVPVMQRVEYEIKGDDCHLSIVRDHESAKVELESRIALAKRYINWIERTERTEEYINKNGSLFCPGTDEYRKLMEDSCATKELEKDVENYVKEELRRFGKETYKEISAKEQNVIRKGILPLLRSDREPAQEIAEDCLWTFFYYARNLLRDKPTSQLRRETEDGPLIGL